MVPLDVEYATLGPLHERAGDRFLSLVPVYPSVRKWLPFLSIGAAYNTTGDLSGQLK